MKSLWSSDERFLRIKKSNSTISSKAAKLILLIIVSLIVVVFIVGDVGLINLLSAKRRIEKLEKKIADLKAENEALNKKIAKLKSDPFEVEKVARERYGYIRPGDKVYRFITLPNDGNQSSKGSTP
ncbi:hypothetical protein DRQ05_03535 [bacterium]|nr:MAG: hypothetical protein DRQ05_03535 [bacterium]